MDRIVGAVFPIPGKFVSRFFDDHKRVFVKPASLFRDLRVGMKVVFFQYDAGLVGEAVIKRVIIMEDPMQFFDTYGDAVFLTRSEMQQYIRDRERSGTMKTMEAGRRQWLGLELEQIQHYASPRRPEGSVSPGGQYIRE